MSSSSLDVRRKTRPARRASSAPVVILYSTSLHCWEVWSQSRPLAQGSLEACVEAYPQAPPVTERQFALEASDPRSPRYGAPRAAAAAAAAVAQGQAN